MKSTSLIFIFIFVYFVNSCSRQNREVSSLYLLTNSIGVSGHTIKCESGLGDSENLVHLSNSGKTLLHEFPSHYMSLESCSLAVTLITSIKIPELGSANFRCTKSLVQTSKDITYLKYSIGLARERTLIILHEENINPKKESSLQRCNRTVLKLVNLVKILNSDMSNEVFTI